MGMSLEREEKHLPLLIAICFVTNFLLGGIGEAFPANSFGQLFAWQWGSLLFMAGCSLYAAKLATDRWHISSAGFILLTIGQGIFYTIQNSELNSEAQTLYASGILVFLPGMVFICYCSRFPVWLRVFGLLATLPFLMIMVKIDMKSYDNHRDNWYNIVGFLMMEIAGVCWSYYAFRPHGKRNIREG